MEKDDVRKIVELEKKEYPEVEIDYRGNLSIETVPDLGINPYDLEVKVAPDGRVWVNVNGLCFLRLKPTV